MAGAVALSLASCGVSLGVPESSSSPSQLQTSGSATSQSSAGEAAGASSSWASASPGESTSQATAAQWKTYTDPAKTLSFELPSEWTTQVASAAGSSSFAVEVKDAAGMKMATLQTKGNGLGGACGPDTMRPYTVLASIPLKIPEYTKDPNALEPRFVYRLIQGANHFYASYGIADHPAGADGMACLVYNAVTTDKLGIIMFGDVPQFTSALEGTAGTRAFTTIAEAQAYMNTGEFQNIERMITSLKLLG
ncbi:hypothetical protein [Arthrobacter cryoconiti]|uniref:Lipoprotein n=1 Tax=Arthrobacter cryoconiti TaxID=748907 RepID=A0ABV8QYM1_9MICC|nr:hypothetical protein [Arthrobacter cryoconiti]MCC9068672.1 hypothetical protein [Arthrobacter cryoconiti]